MCRKSYGLSVYLVTLHLISHELVHIMTRYDCLRTKVVVRVIFEPTQLLTNFDLFVHQNASGLQYVTENK